MYGTGKRRIERFGLTVPAQVTIHSDPPGYGRKRSMRLTTKNISSEGAFLITDRPLRAGTKVDIGLSLSFHLAQEGSERKSHIRVRGRVIRVETNGMAVRFDRKYHISAVEKIF